MLKKHNKLIMLLVLVTFMFTMVGSAGAATFSDVSGTSVESSAIYKLNGLGIIDGYPDGTFGPEKTITRAEFAKIACVTAGLKSVASGMGGTASPFSDVATDNWANGWINVAAAQGFVKGDPAGTFRPEAQITQAEVVTVLLRLLGYNDNLAGEWPSDYIAKAANLGVLDDVTFVANQSATRGIVAILTSATLDENIVEYAASDNLFNAVTPAKTLMADKFDSSVQTEKVLAYDFTVIDGEYTLYYKDLTTGATSTKKLDENCTFSGATSIIGVMEHVVDFVQNKDGDIIVITIKPYNVVANSKVELTDAVGGVATKVKVDGTKYDILANVHFQSCTGANAGIAALTVGTYENSDIYKVVLNKDGKVAEIKATTLPTPGIVDKVASERLYFKDNASPAVSGVFVSTGNFKDKDTFVQLNGKPAALADLQENDTVNVMAGYRGTDFYLIATRNTVSGTLNSAQYAAPAVNKVNVGGTLYKTASVGSAAYSIDGGSTFEGQLVQATLNTDYDLWGQEVKLLLTATGKVAGIVFNGADASSKSYGVITNITSQMAWTDGTTVRNIKIMKADGSEYSYPIYDDTYIKIGAASTKIKDLASLATIDATILSVTNTATGAITAGNNDEKLVSVSLKSNGLVDRIEVINQADQTMAAGTIDTDNTLVKIGSTWVDATDVVVFSLNNGVGGAAVNTSTLDDTKVVGWSELKKLAATDKIAAWYIDSNNKLKYVVVNKSMSSGVKYAIYSGQYSDADSWIELVGLDAMKQGSGFGAQVKGDVIGYTTTGDEINMSTVAVAYGAAATATVDKIVGNTVQVTLAAGGTASYKIDSDTVYLNNADKDDLQVIESVSVGDEIVMVPDATDADLAAAIVVVD